MPIPCNNSQRLTMAQAQNFLRQAGFPENDIVDMSAILKQESQLCPLAYNKIGEYSIGLAQINMKAHGTKFGTEQQLYEPLTNLKAALYLYKNGGKNHWGAYTRPKGNPAYKKYLAEANAAYTGKTGAVILDSKQVKQVIDNSVIAPVKDKPKTNSMNTYAVIGLVAILILTSR